jgi:hypothetical protein
MWTGFIAAICLLAVRMPSGKHRGSTENWTLQIAVHSVD